MDNNYHILLIEDEKVMHMLFSKYIKELGITYDFTMVSSFAEAKEVLDKKNIDVVVSDFLLGDGTAFDVLELVPDIPVIVVTGMGDEQLAVTALKRGAYDYIAKGSVENFFRHLFATVENAINFGKTEKQLKLFLDIAGVIIMAVTREQRVSFINKKGCVILGYEKKAIVGSNWIDKVVPEQHKEKLKSDFQKLFLDNSEPEGQFEMSILTCDGNRKGNFMALHTVEEQKR